MKNLNWGSPGVKKPDWRAATQMGLAIACLVGLVALLKLPESRLHGQSLPEGEPGPAGGPDFDGPPPFGPDGFGPGRGFGGPGGPGGPMQREIKLVKQFDKDGDERLNNAERKAAREFLSKERSNRGSGGRRGPRGGFGGEETTPQPGRKLSPADVKSYPNAPLYAADTLRTFFLEFENTDWEAELADFKNTDVEVPAKLTVDGVAYPDVGAHFRGMSSFMMVGAGHKRSLNLTLDFAHKNQNLGGYRTFNLLNAHEDPTFLRTVLFFHIAREYIPAPKANLVRVVINGECWGLYASVQQFNKDFVKEWYGTTKGARWKVPGSPGGRGSLAYLGDEVAQYQGIYSIKTKNDPKSWSALILLCKTLNETPPEKLEEALSPMLDIDGALKFLAIENVLVNNDGYWVRTSDYDLYRDEKGQFHLIPLDSNETFSGGGGLGGPGGPGGPGDFGGPGGMRPRFESAEGGGERIRGRGRMGPGGPGVRGGPRAGGIELDPLVAANDSNKPLLSKLLAVPALRTRYLGYVQDIATKWLDWKRLEPLVKAYQGIISEDVAADTRKLHSTEAFLAGVDGGDAPAGGETPNAGRSGKISLKRFAEQRRAFLLEQALPKHAGQKTASSGAVPAPDQ